MYLIGYMKLLFALIFHNFKDRLALFGNLKFRDGSSLVDVKNNFKKVGYHSRIKEKKS